MFEYNVGSTVECTHVNPSAALSRSVRHENSSLSLGSGAAATAQPAPASAAASARQPAPAPPRHASAHSDSGTASPSTLLAACGDVSDLPLGEGNFT